MTENTQKDDRARDQAATQMDSIHDLIAALDHAAECRDDDETCTDENFLDAKKHNHEENWHDEDAARQAIDEDPLTVRVRSGWYTPPGSREETKPEEYEILLCTGGPAVRIMGELDEHGEVYNAWLEYQDWGTPWTTYFGDNLSKNTLIAYARNFIIQ